MQNLLLFQINDRQFGIRMSFVKKVQNTDAYQTNKDSLIYPQSLLIDGEEIPLYDLNEMFSPQINPVVDLVRQKILLTEDQNRLLAFLIARIDGVVAVSEEQIKRLPLTKKRALIQKPQKDHDAGGCP